MNLLCALPSIVTVENLIRQHHIQLNECYFRFEQLRQHMNTLKTNFIWGSEDCTGVVSHINRQNFSSCIKISSDDVLKILYDQNDTKGTYVYLSLINLTISAFIDTTTPIDERLY
ncbi:unnamed protein product, partial [Didymodactylos carnosus]